MDDRYKEVHFGEYCKTCKYLETDENDVNSPCWDCLQEPVNLYSHMPVKYIRGASKVKSKKND